MKLKCFDNSLQAEEWKYIKAGLRWNTYECEVETWLLVRNDNKSTAYPSFFLIQDILSNLFGLSTM